MYMGRGRFPPSISVHLVDITKERAFGKPIAYCQICISSQRPWRASASQRRLCKVEERHFKNGITFVCSTNEGFSCINGA